ncbi:MAG: aminotransferase class I/II-fold pyridoxal phosphate-dependent enzyme [Pseudomonadales bacterium]
MPLKPQRACYLNVNISSCGIDAETFSSRLIEEYQVAVTPGTDFGTYRAQDHVRFAYSVGEQDIRRGIEQISRAVRQFQNEV